MLAVFSKNITPRLEYVLDFCFKEKGCEYVLKTDADQWTAEEDATLNYSALQLDCDFAIEPLGLLDETDIDQHLKLELKDEKLALRGDTDPFSVIFYILSRYEEYQPHTKDVHGRFASDQSQQTELNVLARPICDLIVKKLWKKLGLDYKTVQEKFELVPSFDIDIAWAYKHRPFWRKVGAFSKGKIGERLGVLVGGKKDPYDTFGKIVQISSELERIICFTPVADYGPMDKNISYKNEHYRSLIRGLNADGGLGLHPGYNSFDDTNKLAIEKARLEKILGHSMTKSRFHFLRFDVAKTYPKMIGLGFTKDYSMGYADSPGFRAGTSFPFKYYNLNENERTDYLIFPFAYMDCSYRDYLGVTPEAAIEEIENLMRVVKDVGGVFMCVWHNHSINDKGHWKGWYQVLEKTILCAKSS